MAYRWMFGVTHGLRGPWSEDVILLVRSAYGAAVRLGSASPLAKSSTSSHHRWFWRQLWKSKTPGKSKHLIWRAYHNILPTRANLFQRHILSTPVCPVCQQMEEDVSHALWGCPYARDVWSLTSPRLQKSVVSAADFSHIARYLFWRLSKDERHQWVTISWALWAARNKFVFDGFLMPPAKVVEVGNNLWGDFRGVSVRSGVLP
jgi:hypothetical protein